MTPRELDVDAIGHRLRTMRRLLTELERLGTVDAERFVDDFAA